MMIAYDSKTGNVARFVESLGLASVRITPNVELHEPFVLITYTTGFGQVPDTTLQFLQANHHHMQGVIASGNRVWGHNFAISADKISEMYAVPILHKLEMSGTSVDVEIAKERVRNISYETHRVEQ